MFFFLHLITYPCTVTVGGGLVLCIGTTINCSSYFIDVLQLSPGGGAFRSAAIVAGPKRRGSIQSVVDEFPTWTRGVVSGSHPRRGSWGCVTEVVFRSICIWADVLVFARFRRILRR